MAVPKINYQLQCGHVVNAPATLMNGPLYCGHHNLMSPIVDVLVIEWRAKCSSCRYARWAGVGGKQTGEIFANGHIRRNTGHRVSVERATNPDAEATKIKFDAWHTAIHS